MKISEMEVENFKSIRRQVVHVKDIFALIGRNNSGKSNFIKALGLFFNPSTKDIDRSIFYKQDSSKKVRIRVKFSSLNEWELNELRPWMKGDDFIMERQFEEVDDDQFSVSTYAVTDAPQIDWLNEKLITGANIPDWWDRREELIVGSVNFSAFLGEKKPNVTQWKESAKKFLEEAGDIVPYDEVLSENPKGYAGVLKGCLPQFIYVPAVRSIEEEAKVNKTNPFGQLIHAVLESIPDEQKGVLKTALSSVSGLLNRGDDQRISKVQEFEERLNRLMADMFECDVEIEIGMPEVEEVLKQTSIQVDDGWRTHIDAKGSGLQRSMIFTILRAYAELKQEEADEERGARSIILAIEEPEIYLHPQHQVAFYNTLRSLTLGSDQVIYTTHSPSFLDVSRFDQLGLVKKLGEDGCESCLTQVSIDQFINDLKTRYKDLNPTAEGVREQYSNVFGGRQAEGFFADKIVIVEGDSEKHVLDVLAPELGVDFYRANIGVVVTGGKGHMDRLVRLFGAFSIPCYVVIDSDTGEGNSSAARKKTVELMSLMQMWQAPDILDT